MNLGVEAGKAVETRPTPNRLPPCTIELQPDTTDSVIDLTSDSPLPSTPIDLTNDYGFFPSPDQAGILLDGQESPVSSPIKPGDGPEPSTNGEREREDKSPGSGQPASTNVHCSGHSMGVPSTTKNAKRLGGVLIIEDEQRKHLKSLNANPNCPIPTSYSAHRAPTPERDYRTSSRAPLRGSLSPDTDHWTRSSNFSRRNLNPDPTLQKSSSHQVRRDSRPDTTPKTSRSSLTSPQLLRSAWTNGFRKRPLTDDEDELETAWAYSGFLETEKEHKEDIELKRPSRQPFSKQQPLGSMKSETLPIDLRPESSIDLSIDARGRITGARQPIIRPVNRKSSTTTPLGIVSHEDLEMLTWYLEKRSWPVIQAARDLRRYRRATQHMLLQRIRLVDKALHAGRVPRDGHLVRQATGGDLHALAEINSNLDPSWTMRHFWLDPSSPNLTRNHTGLDLTSIAAPKLESATNGVAPTSSNNADAFARTWNDNAHLPDTEAGSAPLPVHRPTTGGKTLPPDFWLARVDEMRDSPEPEPESKPEAEPEWISEDYCHFIYRIEWWCIQPTSKLTIEEVDEQDQDWIEMEGISYDAVEIANLAVVKQVFKLWPGDAALDNMHINKNRDKNGLLEITLLNLDIAKVKARVVRSWTSYHDQIRPTSKHGWMSRVVYKAYKSTTTTTTTAVAVGDGLLNEEQEEAISHTECGRKEPVGEVTYTSLQMANEDAIRAFVDAAHAPKLRPRYELVQADKMKWRHALEKEMNLDSEFFDRTWETSKQDQATRKDIKQRFWVEQETLKGPRNI